MRMFFFPAIVFSYLTLPANATEHQIFHTARIDGHRTISLNLLSNDVARDRDFDIDVVITILEKNVNGKIMYIDWSRHLASIKCGAPAIVKVGGTNYNIDYRDSAGVDWKRDLWAAICKTPMS
ncbi:hypothetical protein [Hoeflea sp. EC-HK425]|jgi:hypothetical protein|uniref:hypothetical protein n=1 Tax=Hoeflea sp. EC-HK425 TaxID=2038388 RepID=UPI001254B53E|nr:hypothetical protein [Hoeflea sp. EC-HK425]VVT00481.1 conserved hypothetical protein [Hoeflea sp. EC-HK425]